MILEFSIKQIVRIAYPEVICINLGIASLYDFSPAILTSIPRQCLWSTLRLSAGPGKMRSGSGMELGGRVYLPGWQSSESSW